MQPKTWGLLRYHTLQLHWGRSSRPRSRIFIIQPARLPRKLFSSFTVKQRSEEDHSEQTGQVFSPQSLVQENAPAGVGEIVARARAYNILNRDQLRHESFVASTQNIGTRLVDQRSYCEDFYLWTILLDYQQLKFGDRGVKTIWQGMRVRGCQRMDFPFTGYQGDRLWYAFVATGTQDPKFLEELVKFELSKGCQRPSFFQEVIGGLLKVKNPSLAKHYARMIYRSHNSGMEEVFEVFLTAFGSGNVSSLGNFCDVYDKIPKARVYGKIIKHLCEHNRLSDAWTMHRYLLSREDLPQDFDSVRPLVKDLANNNLGLDSFLHGLASANVSFEAQARRFYQEQRSLKFGVSSENLNIVSSSTLGLQPRHISDEFIARAFATTAFSFEAVLNGLLLFGLKAIGPSAVRAMGLTANSPEELLARFAKLTELKVDTGSSAFVRLVKRLAQQRNTALLSSVLESDQHHEVFEDYYLQKQLLVRYYQEADWKSFNRTLTVLVRGEMDREAQASAANLTLQAALCIRDYRGVLQNMSNMRRHGHTISRTTINYMYRFVLPKRQSTLPLRYGGQTNHIGFLIAIWQDAMRSGAIVDVSCWREPLRRLGMLGRMNDLESTIVWLAAWYSRKSLPEDAAHQNLRKLLSPALQHAIIAWGYIHSNFRQPRFAISGEDHSFEIRKWTSGVVLLQHLDESYPGIIDVEIVRRTCVQRLRQLFNRQAAPKLLRNFRLMLKNRASLRLHIQGLELAWKCPLFPDKLATLEDVMKPRQIRPRDAARLDYHRHTAGRIASRTMLRISSKGRRVRLNSIKKSGRLIPNAETQESQARDDEVVLPVEEVVIYRDIFNASWEDYQKKAK